MPLQKKLVLIFLFLVLNNALAHQDFWVSRNYGNVKVRIETGFEFEEIQRVFIFGQLTLKLAQEIGYTDTIFLDFVHRYTRKDLPAYFISFDNGFLQNIYWSDTAPAQSVLLEDAIVIRQVGYGFDAAQTLRLVEYAIQNLQTVKNKQQIIRYEGDYLKWRVRTLDTTLVRSVAHGPESRRVRKIVLTSKIERPPSDTHCSISYYWENNQYQVFFRGYKGLDVLIKSLTSIYHFQIVDYSTVIIFDTETSFYVVTAYGSERISERHKMKNIQGHSMPYVAKKLSRNLISLNIICYPPPRRDPLERLLLYQIQEDRLIQDVSTMLENDEDTFFNKVVWWSVMCSIVVLLILFSVFRVDLRR